MIAQPSWLQTCAPISLADRALGAYLGFAVGDALGATVEFMTAHEISAEFRVHRHIVGGGWLRLRPGQVTDDTQMCLALGRALLRHPGWDLRTVADSFVAWMRSRPVDIGHTCRRGLRRYMLEGTLCAAPDPDSAGNGAAMRNLPVALASPPADDAAFERQSLEQAHLTHNHPMSDLATLALGRATRRLIHGASREDGLSVLENLAARHPEFRFDPWPGRTSGYVVDTYQTVADAFAGTTSFEECVVRAVNRGGDADTAGALAGQLAGACYGVDAIPRRWLRRLDPAVQQEIRVQASALLARAGNSG